MLHGSRPFFVPSMRKRLLCSNSSIRHNQYSTTQILHYGQSILCSPTMWKALQNNMWKCFKVCGSEDLFSYRTNVLFSSKCYGQAQYMKLMCVFFPQNENTDTTFTMVLQTLSSNFKVRLETD